MFDTNVYVFAYWTHISIEHRVSTAARLCIVSTSPSAIQQILFSNPKFGMYSVLVSNKNVNYINLHKWQ